MRSVYRATTAAICAFLTGCAVAQSVSTNGTMLADDLTSRSRVVVDAFENSSNRVHELINVVSPRQDVSFTNDYERIENFTNDVSFVVTGKWEVVGFTDWNYDVEITMEGYGYSDVHIARSNDTWFCFILLTFDGATSEWVYSRSDSPSDSLSVDFRYPENISVDQVAHVSATRSRVYGNPFDFSRHSDIAPTVSNTVTKAFVESLGIESGVDAQTVTNMTALTPVYGGNGEQFSEWTYVGLNYLETVISMTDNGDGTWTLITSEREYIDYQQTSPTLINFDDEVTATRTENQIIGYTLGSQTNSVLAATNSLISASTITNLAPTRSEVEAGWWSEWAVSPSAPTGKKFYFEFFDIQWNIFIYNEGGFDPLLPPIEIITPATGEETELQFKVDSIEYTATRHRVAAPVPTKISDLPNDAGYVTSTITNSLASTNYVDSATNSLSTSFAHTIASADTTYRRTIGVTNLNQSVQYVNITDTTPYTLEIQLPTDGVTKDWIVYVTSVTNVSLVLPSATYWMADTAYTNDVPPATPTALWFSQVTDGIFILGRQELTPVTITTEE